MQLEDYFEFEPQHDRIRLKGRRIAIEHVLEPFKEGMSPERIQGEYYPDVDLETVYATITYYLHNKEEIDAYLQRAREIEVAAYQEYLKQPPSPVRTRILAMKAQREAEAESE